MKLLAKPCASKCDAMRAGSCPAVATMVAPSAKRSADSRNAARYCMRVSLKFSIVSLAHPGRKQRPPDAQRGTQRKPDGRVANRGAQCAARACADRGPHAGVSCSCHHGSLLWLVV